MPSISPTPPTAHPNTPPTILEVLPPEIKEAIYTFALLNPNTTASSNPSTVQITPTGYSRSPLLQTCKQIRREALKIWYYNTKFHAKVLHFDCTPLRRWRDSFTSLGLTRWRVSMYSTPLWNPCWKNLMIWLRLYHSGTVHGRCPQPAYLLEQAEENQVELRWYVLGIMFDVAKAMRDMRWAEVESVLVDMRPALIAADSKWKD